MVQSKLIQIEFPKLIINYLIIRCYPTNDPGDEPEKVNCINKTIYKNNEWCGLIRNTTGPWAQCLTLLDLNVITGIYDGCLTDVCSGENNKTLQAEFKCKSYEEINDACNEILLSVLKTDWRGITKCRKNFRFY